MSGPRMTLPNWDSLTQEAFLGLLRNGAYDYWYQLFQRKPRVRVAVQRQFPNEADL